jgi:hypothetical protein
MLIAHRTANDAASHCASFCAITSDSSVHERPSHASIFNHLAICRRSGTWQFNAEVEGSNLSGRANNLRTVVSAITPDDSITITCRRVRKN